MKQQLSYNAKEASSDEEVVRASPHRKKWQGRRRKADLLRWLGGEGGKTAEGEEEEEEGAQIKSGLTCGKERRRCCCLLRALQEADVAPRFSREEGGRRVRKRGEGKKQPG